MLHYIYLPLINRDLELFRATWNNHGLSTENGKSPKQLFVLGMLKNANSQLTAVQDVFSSDGLPQPSNEIPTPEHIQSAIGRTRVDVPVVQCPLTPDQQQLLQDQVDPLEENHDHGMALYLRARSFAQQLLTDSG